MWTWIHSVMSSPWHIWSGMTSLLFVRSEGGQYAIELSGGHYIILNGRSMVPRQAKQGDILLLRNGIFAPVNETGETSRFDSLQTLHSKIVVD